MKRVVFISAAMWIAAGAFSTRALELTGELLAPPQTDATPMISAPDMVPEWTVDSLHGWGGRMVDANLFRADRNAVQSAVPADAPIFVDGGESGAAGETASPPPPELPTLRGLIGSGGRWEAVLANLRGRDAAVLVRLGDTVGGFYVREVGASAVVLADPDTILRLTLQRDHP